MMKAESRTRENITLHVLSIIVLISAIGIVAEGVDPTQIHTRVVGSATETSDSSVTIQNYIAIAKSDNLTDGITFGTFNELPIEYANATANYNYSEVGPQNASGFNISVSTDSNVAADFCIKANASLQSTDDGEEIGLNNYTWTNTTSNLGFDDAGILVWQDNATSFTTSYVDAAENVAIGSALYFKFYLNVTAGTEPNTYTNQITFQGVPTGDACS